ncbi:MAG TPA: ammonium transporter [Planctomycetota bacterium]|nr:ammonium transporter [Planctomycetota bacterium]
MNAINAGDTCFVLLCAALVMLMTPGLALFYGGMVRRKNVLATMTQSFALLCAIGVQWVVFGYSLAFGPDVKHAIGSLGWAGLRGVGLEPNADYAATVPHQAFMIYQAMFAIITPALISGAIAERMKFRAFMLFSVLWATFVYDPLAHWVWGAGGFLRDLGALDFAGGTVVHVSAAASALAAILLVGKRHQYGERPMPPHSLVLTLTGAGILWFGWFGFNAGSALAANGVAVSAFVATNTAAAAAGLGWLVVEWMRKGKPTALGLASGAVAGLVAITPAAGYVTPMAAVAIGLAAGALCHVLVDLRGRTRLDDSLDVLGVHGAGGILGALATGVFATKAVNAAGGDGLLYGNAAQLLTQAIAVGVTCVFAFAGSIVILKLVDRLVGLRVTPEEEIAGLDATEHGEQGYILEAEGAIALSHAERVMAEASRALPAGDGVRRGAAAVEAVEEDAPRFE